MELLYNNSIKHGNKYLGCPLLTPHFRIVMQKNYNQYIHDNLNGSGNDGQKMTKVQRYAYMAKGGKWGGYKSYATQTQTVTNPNTNLVLTDAIKAQLLINPITSIDCINTNT